MSTSTSRPAESLNLTRASAAFSAPPVPGQMEFERSDETLLQFVESMDQPLSVLRLYQPAQ